MGKLGSRVIFGCLLVATLSATGCTPLKRSIDEQTMLVRAAEHEQLAEAQRNRIGQRFLSRLEHLHKAGLAEGREEPVVMDVLLLSSGGQHGAFGVGVLAGWGIIDSPSFRRPVFDIVTGVSTGALIAPFALQGTDYSVGRVSSLFREADDSLATLRGLLFFFPWRDSLFDIRLLRAQIEQEIDRQVIEGVLEAHRENRMLLIGASDLDLGRFHIWDMGMIAEKALQTGDLAGFHNAMISSASIPGAFPPIEIDGVLFTDGAAAQATFLGMDRELIRYAIEAFKQRHSDALTPRLRMWMIVNGHIEPSVEFAQQRWVSVSLRSASVLMSYSLRSTLRLMQLGAELIGRDIGEPVEFRYIAIPATIELPESRARLFDQDLMEALYQIGYQLGSDPTSWRTDAIAPVIPGSEFNLPAPVFDAPSSSPDG